MKYVDSIWFVKLAFWTNLFSMNLRGTNVCKALIGVKTITEKFTKRMNSNTLLKLA